MSEDLLRKLHVLQDDYAGQPPVVQRADLREINQMRAQLGLPLVDAHLNEIGTAPAVEVARPEPVIAPDHTEAREIYQAYLKKMQELQTHRAYADQVVEATASVGMTPVRPLATMGTGGGPLLCDNCGKPIVLEGGHFHGMGADAGWKQNPIDDWTSWILGGLVVEIETNGTLRIYHGYPGRQSDCCEIAVRERENARAKFEFGKAEEKEGGIRGFLEQAFPDMTGDDRLELLRKILKTMYSFDPGIGVNRPSTEATAK